MSSLPAPAIKGKPPVPFRISLAQLGFYYFLFVLMDVSLCFHLHSGRLERRKKRRHSSFVPPPMNVDVFINNVEPESSLFLFFFIEIHWMTIAGCRPADRPGAAVASGCFDVGPGGGFGVDLGVGVGAYGQLRPVLVGLRPGPGRLPLRAEDVRLPARARSQLRPRLELRPGRPIAAARLRNSSRRYSSIAISFVIETVCSLTPIESLLNGVVFRC